MVASKEVEIKFLIDDLRELQRKLQGGGFRLVTPPTHEFNILYDTEDQTLRKHGDLLRLRKYGARWLLTHKGRASIGRHKSRSETETGLSDGKKMAAILEALGFRPSFRYEKFRSEWTDGAGHVVLDETPIGNVSEIEGKPRWIDATAKRLGIPRGQYITQSYAEMFFDWKARTRSPAKEMTFLAVKGSSAGKK
jgi:adenylate cyclase class 2